MNGQSTKSSTFETKDPKWLQLHHERYTMLSRIGLEFGPFDGSCVAILYFLSSTTIFGRSLAQFQST